MNLGSKMEEEDSDCFVIDKSSMETTSLISSRDRDIDPESNNNNNNMEAVTNENTNYHSNSSTYYRSGGTRARDEDGASSHDHFAEWMTKRSNSRQKSSYVQNQWGETNHTVKSRMQFVVYVFSLSLSLSLSDSLSVCVSSLSSFIPLYPSSIETTLCPGSSVLADADDVS